MAKAAEKNTSAKKHAEQCELKAKTDLSFDKLINMSVEKALKNKQ